MASQPEVNTNVEEYPDSDGDDNGVDADVNGEEYMDSEDVLFSAAKKIDNPSPATHRHDRTSNAKRKRGGSDADIAILCKNIQYLVRLMESECPTCGKSTLPGKQIDNPSPATHRHDRISNAKRKRGGSDADIPMLCKAIQDLLRLMESESCTCGKSTLPGNEDRLSISTFMSFLNNMIELDDELYCKAMYRCIESQGWREAFMASAPERRMGILKNLK